MATLYRPPTDSSPRQKLLSIAVLAAGMTAGLSSGPLCSPFFGSPTAQADDWTRFLGPAGSSISADSTAIPTEWSDSENVKWKSELPGSGVSSPIVVGNKVFVTSYSGYGMGGEDEQITDLKRHLTCFDADSGNQLWSTTVDAVQPEDPYRPPGVTAHGYASHTPVSDGKHVFAFFGKTGVIAYDLDGNELWRQSVGTGSGPQRWGSASSPIVYQGDQQTLVIVTAAEESESMFGFDAATGKQVWKTEAPDLQGTWSTPNTVDVDGRTDLVVMVPGEVWGLNPETGKLRWYSRGTTDSTASASPIVIDDIVVAVGGRNGDAVAVKAGGKGDVNDSHVAWDANIPGRFATPVAHQGHLYVFSGGVLSCYDATTGERVKQQRLGQSRSADGGERGGRGGDRGGDRGDRGGDRGDRGGDRGGRGGGRANAEYATPVLVDGNLIVTAPGGEFHVVAATPEMEVLHTNKLTDETGFPASPAVSGGRLFLRSGTRLYCIARP
ncbi:PQQ-like beta-propeller repeat protein [Stieleria sp. TO1_6]|uniref:PQQ-binding-like beta-propeller repeat protein n=1 Tax=Stieleria tagensis TaxID=2956795 RepID=UPI00209B3791|nr:PQQ-binding-like beta-propeller repeat protein [Stieleria tagensis]MCO8125042.1 PQQ-like beta-propeller repeat protein [Stieleria tagensis]